MLKEREELKKMKFYQCLGFDQTENYHLLFDGNTRLVEMAKIDAVKEEIQNEAYYLSYRKGKKVAEYLVIDMFKGHVYKINEELYTVKKVDDNILVTDNSTDEEQFLIVDGQLRFQNVKHLGINNYTYSSVRENFKGVPAVRFDNDYATSIRVHWIIGLMEWGIETINKCVDGRFKLLHKVAYNKSKDNSINNLEILLPETDEADQYRYEC